jgi:HSP20 family protein
MLLTRWDPFRELDAIQREAARFFEGRGERAARDGDWASPFTRFSFLPGRAARAYPLVNVTDDKDAYRVEALAPGIAPDSLKVSAVGNQLTIEGEKADSEAVKAEAYHRSERSTGKFVRTLTLPAEIDAEKVTADYRNGLLTVTLPKAESAKPRQIAVHVN